MGGLEVTRAVRKKIKVWVRGHCEQVGPSPPTVQVTVLSKYGSWGSCYCSYLSLQPVRVLK